MYKLSLSEKVAIHRYLYDIVEQHIANKNDRNDCQLIDRLEAVAKLGLLHDDLLWKLIQKINGKLYD